MIPIALPFSDDVKSQARPKLREILFAWSLGPVTSYLLMEINANFPGNAF